MKLKLHLMDGKYPEKLKKAIGTYKMDKFILEITNAPTKKRSFGVGNIILKNEFPEGTWRRSSLALEHFILKFLYKKMKGNGFSWVEFQRPTSYLLRRSGIRIEADKISIKFHFRPPVRDGKIDGRLLSKGFERVLPSVIKSILKEVNARKDEIISTKLSVEDQIAIKQYLADNDYVMFIPNVISLSNKKIRIDGKDEVKTPNSGKVRGILVNGGTIRLDNSSMEMVELMAKSYAYRKPGEYSSLLKSSNELAFMNEPDIGAAKEFGMKMALSVGQIPFKNVIYLSEDGEISDPDLVIDMQTGKISRQKRINANKIPTGKEQVRQPMPAIKRMKKLKLMENSVGYGNKWVALPFTYTSTIVEKSQLRGLVDAANMSQRYIDLSIKPATNKIMNLVNKNGLSTLGLGFYTEFTGWQLFYLLWKISNHMNL